MRIVTRCAGHLAVLEASRLAETVSRLSDIEFVGGCTFRIRVKEESVFAQGLAGLVREWPAIISPDGGPYVVTAGFEMALHAHIELPAAIEAGRIDDGTANGLKRSMSGTHQRDMRPTGAVTSLTIDAIWQRAEEDGFVIG